MRIALVRLFLLPALLTSSSLHACEFLLERDATPARIVEHIVDLQKHPQLMMQLRKASPKEQLLALMRMRWDRLDDLARTHFFPTRPVSREAISGRLISGDEILGDESSADEASVKRPTGAVGPEGENLVPVLGQLFSLLRTEPRFHIRFLHLEQAFAVHGRDQERSEFVDLLAGLDPQEIRRVENVSNIPWQPSYEDLIALWKKYGMEWRMKVEFAGQGFTRPLLTLRLIEAMSPPVVLHHDSAFERAALGRVRAQRDLYLANWNFVENGGLRVPQFQTADFYYLTDLPSQPENAYRLAGQLQGLAEHIRVNPQARVIVTHENTAESTFVPPDWLYLEDVIYSKTHPEKIVFTTYRGK